MKVAVFGKPGGGKSTLSQRLASAAGLPLHQLDVVQFETGGVKVPDELLVKRHRQILSRPRWVLDGFGTPQCFAAMVEAADVLVYVERAPLLHYWWVTKRLLKSPFSKPLGWPEQSPVLRSTFSAYGILRQSFQFWTPALKARLLAMRPGKRVYIVRTRSDEAALLKELERSAAGA